jgi:hypothetical protein
MAAGAGTSWLAVCHEVVPRALAPTGRCKRTTCTHPGCAHLSFSGDAGHILLSADCTRRQGSPERSSCAAAPQSHASQHGAAASPQPQCRAGQLRRLASSDAGQVRSLRWRW